jgi:hypothetical protein
MSVKTKLLSEEAVLTSKLEQKDTKKATTFNETEKDDEIALASLKLKGKKKEPTAKTPDDPKDTKDAALIMKGKGGKGDAKGKANSKGNYRWQFSRSEWNWDNSELPSSK